MTRQRMRKGPPSKSGSDGDELLMSWLIRMLDEERLEGLRWEDKPRRKFRIAWTHRSAEKWSEKDVEVQKAWAIHKGNNIDLSLLDKKGTDPATLKAKSNILKKIKATFRCALNSKKELHLNNNDDDDDDNNDDGNNNNNDDDDT
ncbi:interferon regulatory factor 8-like [Uloborus diversus]|uniref:interferon regulatory factor 8-like n=1 Tax=Uloborus diversus TaxID=327109 RepID=UPI002409081C|nr:interferon regulatory factor 8-like [Uloborus diversus]